MHVSVKNGRPNTTYSAASTYAGPQSFAINGSGRGSTTLEPVLGDPWHRQDGFLIGTGHVKVTYNGTSTTVPVALRCVDPEG